MPKRKLYVLWNNMNKKHLNKHFQEKNNVRRFSYWTEHFHRGKNWSFPASRDSVSVYHGKTEVFKQVEAMYIRCWYTGSAAVSRKQLDLGVHMYIVNRKAPCFKLKKDKLTTFSVECIVYKTQLRMPVLLTIKSDDKICKRKVAKKTQPKKYIWIVTLKKEEPTLLIRFGLRWIHQ